SFRWKSRQSNSFRVDPCRLDSGRSKVSPEARIARRPTYVKGHVTSNSDLGEPALFGFNSKRIPKLLKVLKPTILRAKRMDNQQSSFRVKSLCNQNRRGRAVEELIAQ